MSKLLECTRGPWEAILPSERGTGHNWTIRAGSDVCVAESGRWLITDPHTESRANAHLIAAAFDHALIGWAVFQGGWKSADCILWDGLKTDPFGFPILTNNLRARLIAEMERAK